MMTSVLKEQLLLETLRANYFEFDAAWRMTIADAGPLPVNQITEVIKTIHPSQTLKKIAIWVAYWGEAPSRKTYLEICAAHDLEWDNALENILQKIVDKDFNSHNMSLAATAQTLTAMMDGFWVESLIAADRYRAEDAIKACLAYLASFFPNFKAT